MTTPAGRFLAATLAVAFSFGFAGAAASHDLLPQGLTQPLLAVALFSPALVAAWLVTRSDGAAGLRRLVTRLWRRGAPWWVWAVAVVLPFAVNAVALMVATGLGASTAPSGRLPTELQTVGWWLLPLLFVLPAAAEELGWRGYALPWLQQRTSALAASVIIGVVWALWHLPLVLVADSPQATIPFGWYVLATVAISVVFTWVHNLSAGSLAPVVVLHAGVPVANIVLPVLPNSGDQSAYLVTVALYIALALVVLARAGNSLGYQHSDTPARAGMAAQLPGRTGSHEHAS